MTSDAVPIVHPIFLDYPRKLIVYGKGDYSQLIADLVVTCGHEVVGFCDDSDDPRKPGASYALGVGYKDLPARASLVNRLGPQAKCLVHPQAIVHPSVQIGEGAVIMAGATVDRNVRIGRGAVIWNGATIIHDVQIGQNTFVCPGATVCGFTVVGPNSFIGAGATVVDKREVPANTRIKAHTLYKGEAA